MVTLASTGVAPAPPLVVDSEPLTVTTMLLSSCVASMKANAAASPAASNVYSRRYVPSSFWAKMPKPLARHDGTLVMHFVECCIGLLIKSEPSTPIELGAFQQKRSTRKPLCSTVAAAAGVAVGMDVGAASQVA